MVQQRACTVNHVDHVGLAVTNLREAVRFYCDVFGIPEPPILEEPSHGLIAVILAVGQTRVELLQATREDSTIGRFIAQHGEGIHHIAFAVDDIHKSVEILEARGIPLTDEQPRQGLTGIISYLHPSATSGVLVELVQPN